MSKKNQVIVVGAGMSGIAAARTLHDAGVNVMCLEARERLGGRTHTDHTLDTPIDLGGSWIHGPIGNPLTPLADRYGVGYSPSFKQSPEQMVVFRGDGSQLSLAELNDFAAGRELANVVWTQVSASLLQAAPQSARSLAELCEYGLAPPDGLSPAGQLGFYYGSRLSPSIYDSGDPALMDWRLGEAYVTFPGDDILLHGGGYKQIAEGLAQGLDIRTNKAVTNIKYDNGGVTVTTADGESLSARQLILTAPLGVLKSGAIKFEPELPTAQQGAIERIGFGSFEKLALRFDKVYWPADKQVFLFFEHDVSDGDDEIFHSWVNLTAYNGEPVLIIMNSGQTRGRRWNGIDDETLLNLAIERLRQMFGKMPEPLAWVRTGWQRDPFSRGAYSFDQVGQATDDRQRLAESIDDRLFISGEAIHPHFYATVHGAYEAGVWTAQKLLGQR